MIPNEKASDKCDDFRQSLEAGWSREGVPFQSIRQNGSERQCDLAIDFLQFRTG